MPWRNSRRDVGAIALSPRRAMRNLACGPWGEPPETTGLTGIFESPAGVRQSAPEGSDAGKLGQFSRVAFCAKSRRVAGGRAGIGRRLADGGGVQSQGKGAPVIHANP